MSVSIKIGNGLSAPSIDAVKPVATWHAEGAPAGAGRAPGDAAGGDLPAPIDKAALEQSLRKLNLMIDAPVRLSFQLHEASGRMMVRVINEETGEVIKEIPPKEILDTVARIMEFVGLLLDRRV